MLSGRLFDKCATIVAETTVWAELVCFRRFFLLVSARVWSFIVLNINFKFPLFFLDIEIMPSQLVLDHDRMTDGLNKRVNYLFHNCHNSFWLYHSLMKRAPTWLFPLPLQNVGPRSLNIFICHEHKSIQTLGSHSFKVLILIKDSSPLGPSIMASCSHLTIRSIPSPRFHLRYLQMNFTLQSEEF